MLKKSTVRKGSRALSAINPYVIGIGGLSGGTGGGNNNIGQHLL
jgi:hypothetical protein